MAILILVLAALLMGCGSAGTLSPSSVDSDVLKAVPPEYAGKTNPLGPDSASAGAELFETDCASCHGSKGLGDGPASQALAPKPANLLKLSKVASDDFLYWRVSAGVEGTVMPAWRGVLNDQQIWQVISFIRMLK